MNQPAAQNVRMVRYPNGHWAAIGAVPIGTSYFVINEIVDERPFREEALRRVATVIAPSFAQQRARCTAISGTDPDAAQREYADMYARVISAIRQAADVLINRQMREILLQKIGQALQNVANVAGAIQRGRPEVGVWTGSPPQIDPGRIVTGVMQGDTSAIQLVVQFMRQMQDQQHMGARAAMQALLNQATTNPQSALAFRSMFASAASSIPIAGRLVQVMDQMVAARNQQWERAQRT